jgi:hypothetical protein
MTDDAMLEKLKADRQLCLLRLRRYGVATGGLSVAAFAVHYVFHFPPLLNTCALVACMWLAVANFGIAYTILSLHIRRISHD